LYKAIRSGCCYAAVTNAIYGCTALKAAGDVRCRPKEKLA
jgi:hypothetical protein